jgi:hypothetical protein
MLPRDIPKKEEIQEWKNHGYSPSGIERCCSSKLLAKKDKSKLWPIMKVLVTRKMSEVLFLHNKCTPLTRVRTIKAISKFGQFFRFYTTMLTSHKQIFTCLFPWKTACEDIIVRYRGHFSTPFMLLRTNECSLYRPASKMEEDCWKKWGQH